MVGINQPGHMGSVCDPRVNSNPAIEHESPGSEELNNEAQDSRHLVSDDERVDRVREQMERKVKIFCTAAKGGFAGLPLESTLDSGRSGEIDCDRVRRLECELKAKTRDNESLLARMFEFERERVELSEEKDLLKEQLSSQSKRVADLEARVGGLLRERERSKTAPVALVNNSADVQGRLRAAEVQCRRLKEERETTTTQNRIMRNQVDAYITSLKKSDDSNKLLQDKLDAANAELAALKDVTAELDVAKKDSSMKSAALRALSGQVATREMENSSLVRSADVLDSVHCELRREVVDLRARLAAAGMEVLSLRDLNARLDAANLARLEKENADLKLALHESVNAVACRDKDLQALDGAHRSTQSVLRASKKMQAAAVDRVRELEGVEAKNAELNRALEDAVKVEHELNVLKGVHKSMLSVMNASKIRHARVVLADKELRAELASLRDELQGAQSALTLRNDEVASLGAALDAAHTEVEVLKGISQVDKSLIHASSNRTAVLEARAHAIGAKLDDAARRASDDKAQVIAENRRLAAELVHVKSHKGLSNIDLVALAVGGLVATLLFAFLIKM